MPDPRQDDPTSRINPLYAEKTKPDPREDRDPWKHRAKGMRCVSCMFFVPKETLIPVGPDRDGMVPDLKTVGRCRRHAPTMSGYPVVFDNDWCGDHKLDETKL